ncbi:MAG TPA: SMI1/KNR4 family protein [Kofleriaceae bacterium]|jgi:hypothetical protein|nr:SMI1/KNR4 family protein [Kofleriaceae bacterium]
MVFEVLAAHVESLGGVRSLDAKSLKGLDEDELARVSELLGAALPAAWKWWLSTYGVGIEFAEPVVYDDVIARTDVMIGWFMTIDEMRETVADVEDSLAAHRLPFNDDASGNYLLIDSDGAVSWYIHDALTDRNTKRVAPSFEDFLLMLRRGE